VGTWEIETVKELKPKKKDSDGEKKNKGVDHSRVTVMENQ